MNKLSITLCAILFACLLLGSECLKINHFESDFKKKMNHKFSKLFHAQDDAVEQEGSEDLSTFELEINNEDEIPSDFTSDLFTFVFSDQTISAKAMSGEVLSNEEAERIKEFLKSNQGFRNMALGGPAGDQCFEKLSNDQKSRFVDIVINQMDFTTIFSDSEGNEPFEVNDDKLNESLAKDQDLVSAFATCHQLTEGHKKLTSHKQEQSSSQSTQSSQSSQSSSEDDSDLNLHRNQRKNNKLTSHKQEQSSSQSTQSSQSSQSSSEDNSDINLHRNKRNKRH